jgi:hypothetical protein
LKKLGVLETRVADFGAFLGLGITKFKRGTGVERQKTLDFPVKERFRSRESRKIQSFKSPRQRS